MSRQLIGITRAGQGLAIAACTLVLVTGCTRAQTPAGATENGATGSVVPSESVVPTESATQPPTSPTESAGSASAGTSGGGGSSNGANSGGNNSGGNSSGGNSSGGNSSGGGGNGADGGNEAAGSPIDVPSIPDKHVTMDEIRAGIPDLFITACGGHDLCVKLVYGDGPCFAGYDPATRAPRGSTVRVLTESQEDCDRANGLDGSGSSTDGTTPDTGPSTDVPSSGTTTTTDAPGSGTSGGTDTGVPSSGQSDGSSG
jgi:hypothetical protein